MYLSPPDILTAIERIGGVTLSELWGRGRHPAVTASRRVAVHIARTRTILSYPDVSRLLLGRPAGSHSSAVTMERAFWRWREVLAYHGSAWTLGEYASLVERRADFLAYARTERVA